MSSSEVFLVRSFLRKHETAAFKLSQNAELETYDGYSFKKLVAHWQLECHDFIFEIEHIDGTLKVKIGLKNKNARQVFDRRRIGETTMSVVDIGRIFHKAAPEGPYNLAFRNCQTTTKDLAEKIVTTPNTPSFVWPWRSSQIGAIVGGAAVITVAGVAGWYLVGPSLLFSRAGPTLFANSKNVEVFRMNLDWGSAKVCVEAVTRWAVWGHKTVIEYHIANGVYQAAVDMEYFGFVARKVLVPFFSTCARVLVSTGLSIIAFSEVLWRAMYDLWYKLWNTKLSQTGLDELVAKLEELVRSCAPIQL